jgi:EAL domain-containing protein (putative c-di-GMP-specific phosphodiesterase class I)
VGAGERGADRGVLGRARRALAGLGTALVAVRPTCRSRRRVHDAAHGAAPAPGAVAIGAAIGSAGAAAPLRHPGFGFALLRLELALPAAGPSRNRGADVGRQAERRLQLTLRPGDAMAVLPSAGPDAPAGFLMVLDGLRSEAQLRAVVLRVQAELAEPFLDGFQPVKPASRLGAVFCAPGQPPRPAEALMQQAERALADAAVGDWALAGQSPRRPDAERLQLALAGDGLQVVFEPQVDLARPMVRALGARLAWRDAAPRRVDTSDCGDDDSLAEALLQRTLSLAASHFVPWRAAEPSRAGCRLALPVSAVLVRRAGWADELAQLLQDRGLAAADLQLELPPSLALQDPNLPARLQALARLGAALALDDFGTGRSSLSALARLPLALLKIDRGFVPQAHEPEHHRVLLESTVRLATQLGIATLGKGLETAPQLALLRGLGCQRGEGAAAAALLAPHQLNGLPRLPTVV